MCIPTAARCHLTGINYNAIPIRVRDSRAFNEHNNTSLLLYRRGNV